MLTEMLVYLPHLTSDNKVTERFCGKLCDRVCAGVRKPVVKECVADD